MTNRIVGAKVLSTRDKELVKKRHLDDLGVIIEVLDWIGRIATVYSLFKLTRIIRKYDLIHIFRYNIAHLIDHLIRTILKTTRHGRPVEIARARWQCTFKSLVIGWFIMTGDLRTAIMELRTGRVLCVHMIEVPKVCILKPWEKKEANPSW